MERDELLSRITTDPAILCGKPTIRGMRVSVEQVLNGLAAGVPPEDTLEDTPLLEPDDIRACLAYAADVMQQYSHLMVVR
jgi:uncharacterized protein (DUF433 family)